MDPKVPLVVPEVNPEDIKLWKETGIIANPNCSTIQMVQSLKPFDELYGIKELMFQHIKLFLVLEKRYGRT